MTQTKTAVVTGGSGGISRELCRRPANDGLQVLVHYGSNQAEAANVVEESCDGGGKAIACAADVADSEGLRPAATCASGTARAVRSQPYIVGRNSMKML